MTAQAGPHGVMVCEDDPRTARLLSRLVERDPGLRLAACVGSGEAALEALSGARPDLLLLDLELPGMDGLQVLERALPALPGLEVLILTTFADEERVFAAMKAGAAGYLVKGLAPSRLRAAMADVLAGGTVIDAALARRFWAYFAAQRGRAAGDPGLTDEELEVLAMVARGLTNPETARALGSSRRAVKAHLERIYRKLGACGRVQATALAIRAGLIEV